MSHARWPPFMARAGELGVDPALTILRADAINNRRREHMADLAREQVDGSLMGNGSRRRVQAGH
ncbi:hypothetical protein [Streptomyces sp. NPDC056061]|uniref:hypothetical protein n=1 Tax=Streptomyces sp. NPDC056061 TaxID=3345700 RepID=UPI0035DF990E